MTPPGRRADAESRLRRSLASLGAARALLGLHPPAYDDAVNRASAAALHAARALIDSRWAKDSQPGWDPEWRPGMPRSLRTAKSPSLWSPDALHRLLDRFAHLAAQMALPADFTQYLRTLVEDGLEADTGEVPAYDDDEARHSVQVATQMVASVAEQLSMGAEFRAASERWPSLYDADNDPPTDPEGLPVPATPPGEATPRSSSP